MKKNVLLICAVPVALVLFSLLTVFFIPNETIRSALVQAAAAQGYIVDCPTVSKRPPLALKAPVLAVSSGKGQLIWLKDVKLSLQVLPLLTGKVRLGYQGEIGSGTVQGEYQAGKAPRLTVKAERVQLEDIPFFSTVAQARVRGELALSGQLSRKQGRQSGELQLRVRGAELAGVKVGGTPLPDASYREVRGALLVEGGNATLKSFTLDGDGIYVRLKGNAPLATPLGNSPLNLTVEMMPKPAFLERQKFIFLLLLKYQTSPGAFSIPVRGTLAHPAI